MHAATIEWCVWPSQLIEPASGELDWLVDAAAAAKVKAAG